MKVGLMIVAITMLIGTNILSGKAINTLSKIPPHNAAFRKLLPNLYQTLKAQQTTGVQFVEYLEHLIKSTGNETTWRLAQDHEYFIGDLLQMLDTIAAEQRGKSTATCLINGTTGTLPALLLTAGLFKIGKHDIELQVLGNEPTINIDQLNTTIRKNLLTQQDRFHINQFGNSRKALAATAFYPRKADTVFLFSQENKGQLIEQLSGAKARIFDYVNRTLS